MGVVEVSGDDQAEHRVAQELEALVGLLADRLRAPRTMDEREAQQ